MKKIPFLLLFLLFTVQTNFSQVKTKKFSNQQFENQIKYYALNDIPKEKMQLVDVEKLLQEDEHEVGLDIPLRFGTALDVDISLTKDGRWFNLATGRVWKLEIESEGAFSINMIFDDFHLPDSAEINIYSSESKIVFGPITSKQNNPRNRFGTDLIMGDKVIIELFEPIERIGETRLHISKVIHGYKNLFKDYTADNNFDSENCNNDVGCPEYDSWDNQADAVALVLLGDGTRFCSGCLLNNTNNDFRPFFLSAFHCIDVGDPHVEKWIWDPYWGIWIDNEPDDSDGILQQYEIAEAEDWIFRFKYESPTPVCDNSETPYDDFDYLTFFSSTFRAGWTESDFALVEMVTTPPQGDNAVFYAGWSRSTTALTSGVCIHHPAGDVKKISVENNTATAVAWVGGATDHWRVNFDDGTCEPGSSGSPLFNQDRRVVGQCHGFQNYNPNLSFCDQPIVDFGRFNVSWNGNNTNNTRLSNWLDPLMIIGVNGSFNGAYRPCQITNLSYMTFNYNASYSNCQITISNSTVTNNSTLTLNAQTEVTLNGNFEVQLGSTLIIQ